ncbi:uncharacterized protein LOC136036043 isoform X1 [Artemia franciscana]
MKPFKKQPVGRKTKPLAAVKKAIKTDKPESLDEILKRAEMAIDMFDYSLAQKYCQKALEIDADNVRALELCGSLLMEVGMPEKAIQCFGRAITLQPEQGYKKYFSVAQLLEGSDSVNCYLKGIEIAEKDDGASNSGIHKEISSAYCSLSELYMTDLCFEDNAESLCEQYVKKSIELDETNPEAYQSYANFLLVKDQKAEAIIQLEKSLSIWFPQFQLIREGKAQGDPVEPCPVNYSARLTTVKLLVELERYETAIEILAGLLEEDDECVQTWYLLGWANFLQGDDFKGNARFYLKKSHEVNSKHPCGDEEMVKHIEELLNELNEGCEINEELEQDGDDEFEDVETSDEEMEA